MYYLSFTQQAKKDIPKLKQAGYLETALNLLTIVANDPFDPPYEALHGSLVGLYSRRISYTDRLVYRVIDTPTDIKGKHYQGTIKIETMWSHYEHLPNL